MSNQVALCKGDLLIIDDLAENLRLLSEILKIAGYKVRCAVDGQTGLMAAKTSPPDLILLDVKMEEIDGYEVCKQLKSDRLTADIPIMFISAYGSIQEKIKAFGVGGVDFITKPFQAAEVIVRINNQLTLRRLQQQLIEKNQQLEQEISDRQRAEFELKQAYSALEKLAYLDGLTRVANRMYLDKFLHHEWNRAKREQESLALILCDIDYFKNYNDTYGHLVGDRCLRQIAHALSKVVQRSTDLVARYGGEEFCLVLSNTNLSGAMNIATAIQDRVQKLHICHEKSPISNYITLSLGLAAYIPSQKTSIKHLLHMADKALYQAKAAGKNQFIVAGEQVCSISHKLEVRSKI
ncbi:diguanylate cyclase domain-containing protein [Merismopedia glauca]|uniref:Diguanylate cyclase response regulator n=1 Tax=Merismopedia glauca CCAP 1448/3 TaxID=1296344 RepID=A0A2T1BZ53_9CYAN|nr:diguanylate cyclase [Merismopedia glauca]PSB01299.1 diguanylate cyclase response regulator [Merismopedia glauca CCAP 1448/3]